MNGTDEQAQEKNNKDPVPWKLRPSDALCSFLRQLGGVTLRVAEAETALETKAIDLVGQSLSALTLEWSLLKADLIILRRVQPEGAHSEVVTLPAMQMARGAVRKVFLAAMAYMAENHAGPHVARCPVSSRRAAGASRGRGKFPGRNLRDRASLAGAARSPLFALRAASSAIPSAGAIGGAMLMPVNDDVRSGRLVMAPDRSTSAARSGAATSLRSPLRQQSGGSQLPRHPHAQRSMSARLHVLRRLIATRWDIELRQALLCSGDRHVYGPPRCGAGR